MSGSLRNAGGVEGKLCSGTENVQWRIEETEVRWSREPWSKSSALYTVQGRMEDGKLLVWRQAKSAIRKPRRSAGSIAPPGGRCLSIPSELSAGKSFCLEVDSPFPARPQLIQLDRDPAAVRNRQVPLPRDFMMSGKPITFVSHAHSQATRDHY